MKDPYYPTPGNLPTVALVYGRGIEGCGVTRWGAELQTWMRANGGNCNIFAYGRKSFLRGKAQQIDYTPFNGDNAEVIQAALEAYDIVIYTSVPVAKTPEGDMDAFYKLVYGVTQPIKVFASTENTTALIKKTPYLPLIINDVDLVMGYQCRADSWLRDRCTELDKVLVPIKNWMSFGKFAHLKTPWTSRANEVLYMGRNAGFKNLPLTLQFMRVARMVDKTLACTFRGVEASFATAFWLKEVEDVTYHYDDTNGFGTGPIHFWNAYNYMEGMTQMAGVKYGVSLCNIDPVGGEGINHMEYAMMEMIALGALPLFHKDWLANTLLDNHAEMTFGELEDFCVPVDPKDLAGVAKTMKRLEFKQIKAMHSTGMEILEDQYGADFHIPNELGKILSHGKRRPKWDGDLDVIAALTGSAAYAHRSESESGVLHRYGDFEKLRLCRYELQGTKLRQVTVAERKDFK